VIRVFGGLRNRMSLIMAGLMGAVAAAPQAARNPGPGTPTYAGAPSTAWGMSVPKTKSQRQKRLERRRRGNR